MNAFFLHGKRGIVSRGENEFQDTDAFEIRSFVREDNILFRDNFEARKSLLDVYPVEAFIVNRVTFRRGLTTWLSNCIVPRFIRSTNLVARD